MCWSSERVLLLLQTPVFSTVRSYPLPVIFPVCRNLRCVCNAAPPPPPLTLTLTLTTTTVLLLDTKSVGGSQVKSSAPRRRRIRPTPPAAPCPSSSPASSSRASGTATAARPPTLATAPSAKRAALRRSGQRANRRRKRRSACAGCCSGVSMRASPAPRATTSPSPSTSGTVRLLPACEQPALQPPHNAHAHAQASQARGTARATCNSWSGRPMATGRTFFPPPPLARCLARRPFLASGLAPTQESGVRRCGCPRRRRARHWRGCSRTAPCAWLWCCTARSARSASCRRARRCAAWSRGQTALRRC